MSHLCQMHRQQLTHTAPEQLKQLWHHLVALGQNACQKTDYGTANRLFASAVEVAQLSSRNPVAAVYADDFLQMEFMASQQLANSLSCDGHPGKAISILSEVHEKLLSICRSRQSSRLQMMGALGVLDNSLLTLTSSLGRLERIDDIYDVIQRTEEVAAMTEQRLWH